MSLDDDTSRRSLRRRSDGVVKTHLEDLQSEMEAGARKVDALAERAAEMRDAVVHRHLDQAALAGALVRRVGDLQRSVSQQHARLGELRRAIRNQRERRER